MQKNRLQTNLARARGLGSAKSGVEHWWLQRVTALALVPLSIWFVGTLLRVAGAQDPFLVADWFSSPVSALTMALMIVALFWHAKLGAQVVIEDYVKHPWMKYGLLLLNTFFCWAAAAAMLLAVLRLHMFDLVGGA